MTSLLGLWAIVISIIALNVFSIGIVAVLHLWRRRQSRGGKVLIAAVCTGLLPASLMVPSLLLSVSIGATAPAGLLIGAVVVFVAAMVVSLPGALIVARKLDAPGEDYRAFE